MGDAVCFERAYGDYTVETKRRLEGVKGVLDCILRKIFIAVSGVFRNNIRMMNKADTLKALQSKLSSDTRWAQRALLAIFRNQTADEQNEATVRYHNQMGFRCMDSIILTSFANQLQTRGSLSPKQMSIVFRLMPKYARQLMKFYGDKIQLAL